MAPQKGKGLRVTFGTAQQVKVKQISRDEPVAGPSGNCARRPQPIASTSKGIRGNVKEAIPSTSSKRGIKRPLTTVLEEQQREEEQEQQQRERKSLMDDVRNYQLDYDDDDDDDSEEDVEDVEEEESDEVSDDYGLVSDVSDDNGVGSDVSDDNGVGSDVSDDDYGGGAAALRISSHTHQEMNRIRFNRAMEAHKPSFQLMGKELFKQFVDPRQKQFGIHVSHRVKIYMQKPMEGDPAKWKLYL